MSKSGKKIEFISLSCGDPEPSRKTRESSMKSTSSAPPAKKSRADTKEQEGHDSLDRIRSSSPSDGVNYKRIQAMFDQLREDLTYTMNTRLRALETEMQDLKKTLESCRKENQTLRKEVGKSLPKSQSNDDILLLPINPQVMDRLEQAPEDDPLYITYVKYIKDMTEIYHHTQLSTVFSEETLFHYNWAGRFQKRAISRSRVFGVIKALWFRNEVAKMKPFISSELDKSRNRLMMRKMRKQQGAVPPRQTREAIDEREEEEEGSEEEVEDKSRVHQEIEDFEDPLNYRH